MTLESAYVLRPQMMEKARRQISMEEDSAIEAPTLSDVFEEYLEAKKHHNGRPMNSEERTLSILELISKVLRQNKFIRSTKKTLGKFVMNCFQRADQ